MSCVLPRSEKWLDSNTCCRELNGFAEELAVGCVKTTGEEKTFPLSF